MYEEIEAEKSPLDSDSDSRAIEILTKEHIIKEESPYFVLNVSKKTTLQNGFRYIKELLMQHHNYKIYSDVKILNDNNIKVYSIKTDALTVHKNDIDKIKSLLNFSTDKIKYYSDLSKEY